MSACAKSDNYLKINTKNRCFIVGTAVALGECVGILSIELFILCSRTFVGILSAASRCMVTQYMQPVLIMK